jgi:CheY-like chemotaxis protein
MADFQFQDVDVLVVDSDANSRKSIRYILQNNGFREIRLATSVSELRDSFKPDNPDLLIADAELPGGALSDVVNDIRHNRFGKNPFLPVIALTWTPTRAVVKGIINSGADDLITKPIASGHLLDRIRLLIDARKPFVVTSDYIGPDRHRASVRPNEIPLVDVPNVLKAKATGDKNVDRVLDSIERFTAQINQTKLEQHAHQIVGIVNHLAPRLAAGGPVDATIGGLLERLLSAAEDTERRVVGTPHEHTSELCQSLIRVTRSIGARQANPQAKDVKLLKPLSQAIQAAFSADVDTSAATRMISNSIGDREFFGNGDAAPPAAPGRPAAKGAPSPAAAAPSPPAAPAPAPEKKTSERRYLFLLRLFIAKVSHLFKPDGARKQAIPRQFVHGFDKYLKMLLGQTLYDQLNGEARSLLDAVDSDDDAMIWREMMLNEQYRTFSLNILVRILLQFREYQRSKVRFLSIINSIASEGTDMFSERHFHMVFSTLFSDIFGVLGDAEERESLDLMIGAGTCVRIKKIEAVYKEDLRNALATEAHDPNDFFQTQ